MPELYLLAFILMIVSPLSGVIYGTVKAMDKFVFKKQKWGNLILLFLGVFFVILGIITKTKIIPWELIKHLVAYLDFTHTINVTYIPVSVFHWILSDFITFGVAIIIETAALFFARLTPEKIMLSAEKRRERRKHRMKEITTIPKTSQLCVGVSGAGKSAYIGKSIDDILVDDPNAFCLVVDGKGSTEQYSLYDNLKIIARKTGKRLVVLNGTANDSLGNNIYDFLDGVQSIDAAKDMIMALLSDPTVQVTAGSEHYKRLTEYYIMQILEFMRRVGIDITFYNVVELLNPDNLTVMEQMKVAPQEQGIMRKMADELWEDVRPNIDKLNMFLIGQGKNIFTGNKEQTRFNIRDAYKHGDIVLVLADEMSMPNLAEKLVQIVAMDLRNLVAGRLTGTIDMDRTVYSYFDEFSSYTAAIPIIKSLYARARSANVIMTLATQSCSDIIGLGGGWFHSLCDTADRFVVFRQNSAEAAEAAAGIFGTEQHVTSTSRTSEFMFTGESSNTVDRQFKVHPDIIRSLETNHGIMLDKKKNEIIFFKNKFVSEK